MAFSKTDKEGHALLEVKDQLTVYDVVALRDEMLGCFEAYGGVILELRDVGECDMAGVQLLFSAEETARATKKKFSVTAASAAVRNAVSEAGLDVARVLNCREEEFCDE